MGELVRGGSRLPWRMRISKACKHPRNTRDGSQPRKSPRLHRYLKRLHPDGLAGLPDGVASFDTHEIAPPYQEDADAQKRPRVTRLLNQLPTKMQRQAGIQPSRKGNQP